MSEHEIAAGIGVDITAAAVLGTDGYVYTPHELVQAASGLRESHPDWTWSRIKRFCASAARANRSLCGRQR